MGYYSSLSELYDATESVINGIGDAYNVGGEIYIYNDLYNSLTDPISEKWKSGGTIKGDKGDKGDTGQSAYELYVSIEEGKNNPNILDEEHWIESLSGDSLAYNEGSGISIQNSTISINSNSAWVIFE